MENRDENTQHLIQESHAQFAHLYQQSNKLADTIAINLEQTTKQYESLKEGGEFVANQSEDLLTKQAILEETLRDTKILGIEALAASNEANTLSRDSILNSSQSLRQSSETASHLEGILRHLQSVEVVTTEPSPPPPSGVRTSAPPAPPSVDPVSPGYMEFFVPMAPIPGSPRSQFPSPAGPSASPNPETRFQLTPSRQTNRPNFGATPNPLMNLSSPGSISRAGSSLTRSRGIIPTP